MTSYIALLKREWLESKAGFMIAPAVALGLIVVITLLMLVAVGYSEIHVSMTAEGTNSLAEATQFDRWTDSELDRNMRGFKAALTSPFYLIYLIVLVLTLLGSLYDDRKDRSVLFWKSMPVSDWESVSSKLVYAAFVAPVITIALSLIAQLFFLVIISVISTMEDLGSIGRLWWHSGIITGTLQLIVGFLIQGLWSLPVFAWLLLVSAGATRLPFLWAVLVPVGLSAIEMLLFRTSVLSQHIGAHFKPAALPLLTSRDEQTGDPLTFSDQFNLLLTPDMWVGVIIGAGLLYAAVYLRKRHIEI